MNKPLWMIVCGTLTFTASFAQPDQSQVRDVIDRLFKGMQLGDSAMVRSTFHSTVTLASSFRGRDGNPQLKRETSIAGFLKAIGTPHIEPWNEEIWGIEIKIDDDFAQVWCNYAFYVGKNFSHCGIDAFHLHKGADGWKIFHLADTRRYDNCNTPKEIADRYKQN